MRTSLTLTALLALLALLACSKPPREAEKKNGPPLAPAKVPLKVTTALTRNPALLQFHYRYTSGMEAVKKELSKQLGFAVDLVWGQLQQFKAVDLWLIPPKGEETPEFSAMGLAACVSGNGKNLVYLVLKDPSGMPLKVKKDAYATWQSDRVQGPKEYTLFDDGEKLCIASDRDLLDRAREWKIPPAADPDHFLTAHLNMPILLSENLLGKGGRKLDDKMVNLTEQQRTNLKKLFEISQRLRIITLGMGIDKELNLKVALPLVLKKGTTLPPALAAKSGVGLPGNEEGEAFSLSFDMNDGNLLGFDLVKSLTGTLPKEKQDKAVTYLKAISHVDLRFVITPSGVGLPRFRVITKDEGPMRDAITHLREVLGKKKNLPFKITERGNTWRLTWDYTKPTDDNQRSHSRAFGPKGSWTLTRKGRTWLLNGEEFGKKARMQAPLVNTRLSLFTLGRFGGRVNNAKAMDKLLSTADTSGEKPAQLTFDSHTGSNQMVFRLLIPVGSWLTLPQKNPQIAKQLTKEWEERMRPPPSDL